MSGTETNYQWDPASAGRKLKSGITLNISTPTPIVSVSKSFDITQPNNPAKDAYRNCQHCGKHYNYHKDGKCP